MSCWLCNHPVSHKHRVLPGQWGGDYHPENVVRLCPNHHAAIHFMMSWYRKGADPSKGSTRRALYAEDRPFWLLWLDRVRPIVRARMQDEGKPLPFASSPRPSYAEAPSPGAGALDGHRIRRLKTDVHFLIQENHGELLCMTRDDLRRFYVCEDMDDFQLSITWAYLVGISVMRFDPAAPWPVPL